jgi:hypothetical protein
VPWVDAVIGHLATDNGTPTMVMDIQGMTRDDRRVRSHIYRDGEPAGLATKLSRLGPAVKGLLWQSAVNTHDFLFYLHAGVVGTGETCVLLPAAAGSGKSSLTAALCHRGFRYFSDEIALIEPETFRVPPVPLALCFKSTGWDIVARYYPDITALPIHERGDGKLVRYLTPPSGAIASPQTSAQVSHIIFPRYSADGRTELKAVARSEALRRLMDECLALRLRLDLNKVAETVRWIAGIDCFEVSFSSLDKAAELVAQVLKRGLSARK